MPQNLANDLIEEILLCLPLTAVSQFRWACKGWLALTSDPYFVRRYYTLHPYPPLTGMFLNRTVGITFLPLRDCFPLPHLPFMPRPTELISSCNGLLLLRFGLAHYICNPTTGTIHILPKPRLAKSSLQASYHLAFDLIATTSSRSASHEFAVVCVEHFLFRPHTPTLFHVYSSATGEWRKSAAAFVPDYGEISLFSTRGVYLKGCMYWIPSNWIRWRRLHVLHIAEDRLTSIPLPDMPEKALMPLEPVLSTSRARLHLTMQYFWKGFADNISSKTKPFDVWEMNPDSLSWTLIYSFTTPFTDDPLFSYRYMQPLMFLRSEGESEGKEEKQDMLILTDISNSNLLFYNIADHTFKEIETTAREGQWLCRTHISIYLPLLTF